MVSRTLTGEGDGQPEVTRPPVPWSSVPVRLLNQGGLRFEARSYLTDGYGQRQRIEAESAGWCTLSEVAKVRQPSRLKAVVVPDRTGLPFLSAGQFFEARPRVRKWIAEKHIPSLADRTVDEDMIAVSRSGNVGRVSAVYPHHEGVVITDDLLRVTPKDPTSYGWLYAYMRTPHFRAIAQAEQYGHMIKHLEVDQLERLPIILLDSSTRSECDRLVTSALDKRRRSLANLRTAEERYAKLLGVDGTESQTPERPTAVVASSVFAQRRRRLDAAFFAPNVMLVERLIANAPTLRVDTVGGVAERVVLGQRFKRFFGPNGTPYRSAEELFDLNAPVTKRIYAGLLDNPDDYMLKAGWIVMACSGQVYGLNGAAMLLGPAHDGIFGSHDLIRIIANEKKIAPGYLLTVLTHPTLGRPMVIRHAYGTSIPHLDPVDIATVPIPRFSRREENRIAKLVSEAAELRDQADHDENLATSLAEAAIGDFLVYGVDGQD